MLPRRNAPGSQVGGAAMRPSSGLAGEAASRRAPDATGAGMKMPKKPVKLTLFQSMRTTASAKAADRAKGRAARSAAEIGAECGLGRDLDIFHAAQVGSLSMLRAVLGSGQPVDATDASRRTALHHAAAQGHFDIAELLIKRGADTMARTRDNQSTPLHEVATGEVAELLIQGKADVEGTDDWNLRPLHYAAQSGNCDVVRCLIEYHAAICPLDGLGRTPLHIAAQVRRPLRLAQLLMQPVGSLRAAATECYQKSGSVCL